MKCTNPLTRVSRFGMTYFPPLACRSVKRPLNLASTAQPSRRHSTVVAQSVRQWLYASNVGSGAIAAVQPRCGLRNRLPMIFGKPDWRSRSPRRCRVSNPQQNAQRDASAERVRLTRGHPWPSGAATLSGRFHREDRRVGAMTPPAGSRIGINSFSSVVGSRGPTPTSITGLSPKVPNTRSQTITAQP